MKQWVDADLEDAVYALNLDAERCPSCGMTDDDARWTVASIVHCDTCADLDIQSRTLNDRDGKPPAGARVRLQTLHEDDDWRIHSSYARHNPSLEAYEQRKAAMIEAGRVGSTS